MISNIQAKCELPRGPDGGWTPRAWEELGQILGKAKRQRRRLNEHEQLALPRQYTAVATRGRKLAFGSLPRKSPRGIESWRLVPDYELHKSCVVI